MKADWSPLRRELALWRQEKLALPLWWRDDDAVAATSALDDLANLSQDLNLPVHLAVIPARAEASLNDAMQSSLIPLVHGWAHRNTAPAGSKKSEFGHMRSQARAEFTEALATLKSLFGNRLVPAFVAPWNRLAPEFNSMLANVGFGVVSTFMPRGTRFPAPGLLAVNTHIDPIDWRATRGLLPPDEIIAATTKQLAERRAGRADNSEPFGYLTHHLVHTSDVWSFSRAFLNEMLAGGAIPTLLSDAMKETP